MGWLLGRLRTRGMNRGVLGGNRRWLTIWAVVMTGQLLHRLLKARPAVVKYELKPGETITVTDLGVAENEMTSR